MQKLSDSSVAQAIKLRSKGCSYKKIPKKLSISTGSAYNYTKKLSLLPEAKNRLLFCENKNRRKFAREYAKEKQITPPKLDKNLALILGHLFFDGCVSYSNGKYMLSYCNSSIELIKEFVSKVHILFSLKPVKISKFKGVNLDWYQSTFYSKKAFYFVKKFSGCFSTSKNIGVPVEIMAAEDSIKESFLLAFWADEGRISARGYLTGSSKSKKMLGDLVILHKSLGIDCKRYLNKTGKAHSLSIKRTLDNYSRFFQKVGFGKAIVKTGYNLGRYKQEVLLDRLHKMTSF